MPPSLEGYLSNFIHPVYRLSTAPVSDETPLHRLAASDRHLRIWRRNCDRHLRIWRRNWLPFARRSTRFAMGGWSPPQSIVDSLSSLSRELVDARCISSDLHGAIRPPSQRPGGFVSSATIRCCCYQFKFYTKIYSLCWSICVLATTIRLRT